jgi:hypothetical protein
MPETFRNPRTIAEEKNQSKPGGTIPWCGACGLPEKECACAQHKEWGTEPRTGGTSAPATAEGSSFKG